MANIFVQPIEKFNAIIELYPKGIAGFKRFLALKDQAPEIVDKPNAVTVATIQGRIDYQDVSFGYEGKKQVLNHINLQIKPGETVAFVGPTGAGKTTLCSLLPRFYEVNEGRILIDGIDIRDFKLSSLRHHIGLVQQDVFSSQGHFARMLLMENWMRATKTFGMSYVSLDLKKPSQTCRMDWIQ
ncbi:lipid A export ATP-binding/permease protein MsbA [Sporolactobacillus inulinus]|uniref:Lipid A export ATP-binding/permease protein MsbA n=1 Tax=Sporolactobacillus inulinus TaxID=2078 RepID=A0A4Y1Z9S5_9BACL|nr:lipid A export ATP-binding/permease protein MsbA [Sporolactobacillus inulinus]